MRRRWIMLALLTSGLGCGLADYEKRMDEQRERLQALDEENKVLGELIKMPSGKDAFGETIKPPFEIFLRPPLGISTQFQGAKAVYASDQAPKVPLYRYSNSSRTDTNMFIALAKIASKSAEKQKEDEFYPEEFRPKVREALASYFRLAYGGWNVNLPDFNQLKKENRQVRREGKQQTIELESAVVDDGRLQSPSRLYIFIHVGKLRQAAVIYQIPAQQDDTSFKNAMEVSLKTLEITSLANAMRSSYRYK